MCAYRSVSERETTNGDTSVFIKRQNPGYVVAAVHSGGSIVHARKGFNDLLFALTRTKQSANKKNYRGQ
jgi:hypothetical protein